ncbi:uncharacterized protein PG986_003330 [Apiospora aurea]|uniref:Luciferase domain-containing protein n=1 Tax=Apiospora aurea TaxID=335848 RepID=A0ABR1QRC7_9PEZI
MTLSFGSPHARDPRTVVGLAVISLGIASLLSHANHRYREWLELGPGGVPYNVKGWLMNLLARPFARFDVRAVAPYTMEDQKPLYGDLGHVSFFGNGDGSPPLPPLRSGARPDVPSYVIPQRQVTEQAPAAMLAKQEAFMAAAAAANASLLRLEPSSLEGRTHNALWLATDDDANSGGGLPPMLRRTRGEFLHPHREGSSHAIFSLTDAARLIELGWAERHPLTGIKNRVGLPWSYVFIYAPRNDEEFAIWKNIVMAAVRFAATASERVVDVKTP